MKAEGEDKSSSLASIFGTKELLASVVQKLSSQALLYSIAIAVIIIVANYFLGEKGLIIIVFLMVIFIIGMVSFLFFEQKRKMQSEDPQTVSKLLANRMSNIQQPSSPIDVKVWTTIAGAASVSRDIVIGSVEKNNSFKIGDKILVHFSSSHDGYLTLLNVGTSGKLTILFPNSLHQNNGVKANEPYTIPASDDHFEYQLHGPPGVEKLKAIVTLGPVNLVETQFDAGGNLFRTSASGVAARDIAVIQKKVEAIAPEQWAEGNWDFKVT